VIVVPAVSKLTVPVGVAPPDTPVIVAVKVTVVPIVMVVDEEEILELEETVDTTIAKLELVEPDQVVEPEVKVVTTVWLPPVKRLTGITQEAEPEDTVCAEQEL
jgi:hypothetical protein